jgi:hypothetical protein
MPPLARYAFAINDKTLKGLAMNTPLHPAFLLAPARFAEGTRVRSYDFPQNRDCYAEGVVEGYRKIEDCLRYVIRVTRRVWGGELVQQWVGELVFPPVNGTPTTFGRATCAVQRIEDDFADVQRPTPPVPRGDTPIPDPWGLGKLD